MRQDLFHYIDLTTREDYLAHRRDFEKNTNQWRLTDEVRALFSRAKEIVCDVETVPEPPVGTYSHLTDGVRSKLGLTYLTSVTHICFYAVVDNQDVILVLVAPFTAEEEEFIRWIMTLPALHIGHNQAFDIRITCGPHNAQVPANTYCTLVGQTTMFGGPKTGYPDGSNRALDSLMKAYGVQDKIVPYVIEAAKDWAYQRQEVYDSDQLLTVSWQSFMKEKRNALHLLPAKWVSAYVISDSVGTYWVYKAQMYWSKILQDQWGYTRLDERHRETQRYQNILNRWSVRGMPVNRHWLQRQLEKIEQEKWRLLPYFVKMGCGDLTKANQKTRFIFDVCQCPAPDKWEYVEFESGHGKWYPAEMQNGLWTDAAFRSIEKEGWNEEKDYSKWYSTGSEAIEYYLHFGPEQHRSKLKLYKYYTGMLSAESTYREWLDHSSYDGKVHPLLTATANTLRTIGDTPNPLNISMHEPYKLEVYNPETGEDHIVEEFTGRGIFAPHEGKVLMEYDASNAEVRFATILSKANKLANAFANKQDLHRLNAAMFLQKAPEDVTKKERTDCKPIFFGDQYGASPRTNASRVYLPVRTVYEMMDSWYDKNWEVRVAKKQTEDRGYQSWQKMAQFPLPLGRQAYTECFNGQWVPAPEQWGRPKFYTMWNAQQQHGVAGIVMPSVIAVHDWLQEHPELNSDIYIMVHDSIIVEVPEDDEESARQVGEYVSMQLSTQVPLELTVVDGIAVPWPSGCDLYENCKKWGWRPDKEFPFDCGEDEGERVFTYPEEDAWEIMRSKALIRAEKKITAVLRDITQHYQHPPSENVVWWDGESHSCISWENTVQYSPEEHYAQSRYWGDVLTVQDQKVAGPVREAINEYRKWVAELYRLDQLHQQAVELYEQTKEFRIPVSEPDATG